MGPLGHHTMHIWCGRIWQKQLSILTSCHVTASQLHQMSGGTLLSVPA